MSTMILILSPLPVVRAEKSVAACQKRATQLGLGHPEMVVSSEHPGGDDLMTMVSEDEEDEDLRARITKVESLIVINSESALNEDPVLVECVRFLLRRTKEGVVQFAEGIAETEVGLELMGELIGIDGFDERDEARKIHERLAQSRYRLLAKRWETGNADFIPRPISTLDLESQEKSWRVRFPPEYRAYLTIVGFGPGPSSSGIQPFDELDKPKTFAKSSRHPKLGKTILVGRQGDEEHLLVCDGDEEGRVWKNQGGSLAAEAMAPHFLAYVEDWLGAGEAPELPCPGCGIPLELKDLEKEYCSGCGTRREGATAGNEATAAFESFAKTLVLALLEAELLEIDEPELLPPLIAGLTEYMSEKGHKWKSPDRAAASIAGWLIHRDEVAELHGSNSDVARIFAAVGQAQAQD